MSETDYDDDWEEDPNLDPNFVYKEYSYAEIQALRSDVLAEGENLLYRVKYEIEVLEQEMIGVAEAFNDLLEEVKELDIRITELTTTINKSKMQGVRELDETIKQEVQTIVEQLRAAQFADVQGIEILYENLDAIKDNFTFLQNQSELLKELGIKTDTVDKNMPALEKGIDQFARSIEERQTSLLVGEEEEEEKIDYTALYQEVMSQVQAQVRAMVGHLKQAQLSANPKELSMLQQNQQMFSENYDQLEQQVMVLEQGGKDITELQRQLVPLAAGIRQFEKALANNQGLKFSQRIYEEIEMVTAQKQEIHQIESFEDLEVMQENVDILFENCDAMADEIDEMADKGHNVTPLLEHYEVLRLNLEQLETMLQDAANRIGLTRGSIQSA